ncbi:MAG: hypothetical protein U0237_17535 [Thermoleophilia bacterium]
MLLAAQGVTDRAAELLREGRYVAALELQLTVLGTLRDSGDTSEGNAFFNAGRARLALAMCEQARDDLQRSVDVGGLPEQMPLRRQFLAQAAACADGRFDRTEPFFQSPTGNLACDASVAGTLRCWRVQPTNVGFTLGTGGQPQPFGGGPAGRGPRLALRQTWGAGGFRCRLEEFGLACRDGSGGRGFFLSRQTVSELDPPTA